VNFFLAKKVLIFFFLPKERIFGLKSFQQPINSNTPKTSKQIKRRGVWILLIYFLAVLRAFGEGSP